ncbi:switch-associated protein 70 isoform X2 [Senna tora]|uniref:Switch-associated protein 70 isoform X2 n=1 Tax=Senna tora TaxID=362788 RepID=A0A834WHX3_9FABA|nr:switch-associated protein 70 isoform X2 [Senna tora]
MEYILDSLLFIFYAYSSRIHSKPSDSSSAAVSARGPITHVIFDMDGLLIAQKFLLIDTYGFQWCFYGQSSLSSLFCVRSCVLHMVVTFYSSIAMSQRAALDTENSLEKIKRQLASGSGRNLLQGPLLKRSETII